MLNVIYFAFFQSTLVCNCVTDRRSLPTRFDLDSYQPWLIYSLGILLRGKFKQLPYLTFLLSRNNYLCSGVY